MRSYMYTMRATRLAYLVLLIFLEQRLVQISDWIKRRKRCWEADFTLGSLKYPSLRRGYITCVTFNHSMYRSCV